MREAPVVVLVCADAEWRALRRVLGDAREGPTTPYGDTLLQGDVLYVRTGWGKIAAAAATQYVLSRWSPRLLINIGTCGGFAGETRVGDVLLVERTVVYDIIEQMTDPDEAIAHYSTCLDLSWLRAPLPIAAARRALMISGDRDLLASEIPTLRARFGAIAGDWESAAIAYVGARSDVRLLVLRAVSDVVGAKGSPAYGDVSHFEAEAERVLRPLVASIPGWIAQAAR
ncbi:MAG: 5'-methylthioadenosine/S-adenosylhomocysteine nucleosidase [Myxococcales bacterium]|nr:5'-methylthioadenosine/S-adenosylhomocysteine nucleosidase [Myxococcales bacterium]